MGLPVYIAYMLYVYDIQQETSNLNRLIFKESDETDKLDHTFF